MGDRWEIKYDDYEKGTWLISRGNIGVSFEVFADGLTQEQAVTMLRGLQDVEDPDRQWRLDEFARAALTGLCAHPMTQQPATGTLTLATIAYDIAEEMEQERSRRIRGQAEGGEG